METQNQNGLLLVGGAILVFMAVGVAGYVFYQNWSAMPQESVAGTQQAGDAERAGGGSDQSRFAIPADWKTYRSEKYGFEVRYPNLNEQLKAIGGWTDDNEPRVTSKASFDYSQCVLAGEGPGMSASTVIIAEREYCLITVVGVEPDSTNTQYEYVSHIGNEDVSIVFSVGTPANEANVDKAARALFSQILSTFQFTTGELYKNDALGFEFRHPKQWVVDMERSHDQTIVFSDTEKEMSESREAITVATNTQNRSLDDVVNALLLERGSTGEGLDRIYQMREAFIGGEKTAIIPTGAFGLVIYLVLHQSTLYTIETQGNLFTEDVLKTIRFTK